MKPAAKKQVKPKMLPQTGDDNLASLGIAMTGIVMIGLAGASLRKCKTA